MFDAGGEAAFLGNAFEQCSLQEALQKIATETSSTSQVSSALTAVEDWLEDPKNTSRAETDPDVYPTILKVLVAFQHRQIQALVGRPAMKKPTAFKIEGVTLMHRTVRAACRVPRRTGPARLTSVLGKLWNHILQVLSSDAVLQKQFQAMPYYCRIIKELADHNYLGYLAVRGDGIQTLVRRLLQVQTVDAKTAAFDAIMQVLRHADGCPSAAVPWFCDHLISGVLKTHGIYAVGCFAVIALRCPMSFRDWLISSNNAEKFSAAVCVAWSSKTTDSLSLVLRLALVLKAPIPTTQAHELILLVVETLDNSLARTEMVDIKDHQIRTARLAELLALLVAHAEGSPQMAVKRLYSSEFTRIEQRCLPWALCAVRLCERYTSQLRDCDELLGLFKALCKMASQAHRLAAQECTAVYRALTAAVTVRAHAELFPNGMRAPHTPVHSSSLSGHGVTAALIAAPELASILPQIDITRGGNAWTEPLSSLMEQLKAGMVHKGGAFLTQRGIAELAGTLFLVSPRSLAENVARQFLALHAGPQPTRSSQENAIIGCGILAAMRQHRPDAAMQQDLYKCLSASTVDVRHAFLKLCASETNTDTASMEEDETGDFDHGFDDYLCALGNENQSRRAVAALKRLRYPQVANAPSMSQNRSAAAQVIAWQHRRDLLMARQFEGSATVALLNNGPSAMVPIVSVASAGSISDDLLLHNVELTVNFQNSPMETQLGHTDFVDTFSCCARYLVAKSSFGVPACTVAVDDFVSKANNFRLVSQAMKEGVEEPPEAVITAATHLMPAMIVVLHVPTNSASSWPDLFHSCLIDILDLARALMGGAAGQHVSVSMSDMLGDLLDVVENLGIPQTSEGGNFQRKRIGVCSSYEIAERCALLAEVCSNVITQRAVARSVKAPADIFSSRNSLMNSDTDDGSNTLRWSSLHLLTVLSCCRLQENAAPKIEEAINRVSLCMRRVLFKALDPADCMGALRLVVSELMSRDCSPQLVELVAEFWCGVPDPASSIEVEDFLVSALRLVGIASRQKDTLAKVLHRLWSAAPVSGTGTGDPRLIIFARKYRQDPEILRPRGKLLIAVLFTHCLHELQRLEGFNIAIDIVSEFCCDVVMDLILKDASLEVRSSVGASCTRSLFSLFDDSQVFPEFDASFQALANAGGADGATSQITSTCITSLQVMLQVALVDGYMQRILPKLCSMGHLIGNLVGNVLEALDHVFFGRSGSDGASLLALQFRAQIFESHLRSGRRLTDLVLKDVRMSLLPTQNRQDLGLHLPAAVAALAIREDTKQIGELATSCGFVIGSPEFDDFVFVSLAGTLLPLRKSLEPLRRIYGADRVLKLSREKGHRVVAFSFQLPFLTENSKNPVDAEAIRVAFEELDPWQMGTDFRSFVCKHFRFLLAHLDRTVQASSAWAPGKVVDLWRGFASWMGALTGSRLRLLLPALIRSGLTLPYKLRPELCVVIDSVVANSSADALVRLASHEDESLRMILKAVETEWGHDSPSEPDLAQMPNATAQCPALCALLAVLRALRSKRGANEGARVAAQWISLQMDSIFSRLKPDAQKCLSEGSDGLYESGTGGAKRRRLGGSDGYSFVEALNRLEPPGLKLAWGPRSTPDLGLLRHAHLRAETDKKTPEENDTLARLLQLLSQPTVLAQLRDDDQLARSVAKGIASMELCGATLLDTELECDAVEGAIYNATKLGQLPLQISPPGPNSPGVTSGVDELLACGALLGTTVLQAHASPHVRKLALEALMRMAALPANFKSAKKVLATILDPQHLCLEDLDDIQVDAADSKTSYRAHMLRTSSGNGPALPEDPWASLLTCMQKRIPFSKWIREACVQLLEIGSNDWTSPAKDILLACMPLARHVDWFAERMLGFAILKAADQGPSGLKLAQTLSTFFKDAVKSREAHSIIRALHFVRLYQTKTRKRAVPHFPQDNQDLFWKHIDLCAAAACASRVGWARDGLLYLELHLARSKPNLSISEALFETGKNGGADAIFQAPGREVQLLHRLAQQLPDAELLYGVPNWCHATSRLARAQLGKDHLGTLHLHSHLREATMMKGEGALQHDFSVGDALARTGLHTVLADTSLPEQACSATWERRMESLWRLRQWGTTSSTDGFNARVHSVFSGLAQPPERCITELAATAAEGPLVGLVSQVTSTLHAGSPEQLRQGAVQLQMVGSIFDAVDAVAYKSSPNMPTLVSRWSSLDAMPSSPQFTLLEPLHSVQATLLSLAAPSTLELRFLTALARRARGAAEPHRALGILEQAQRVAGGAPRIDVLRLRWEQARCFWELREQQQAIIIARAIAGECRSSPSTHSSCVEERGWKARVLSDTGVWLSISRLEGHDVIRHDYFEPAVAMMEPGDAQPRRQLADFLDAQLSEEKEKLNSIEHAMSRRFLMVNETNLKDVMEKIRNLEAQRTTPAITKDLGILRERSKVLQKQCEDDRARERNGRERVKALALSCVQQFGQCLTQDSGNLTKVACRFLSLWFDHHQENEEVTTYVKSAMENLALGPLALFIYQLASRLGGQGDKDSLFQKTLEELLVRLCSRSPLALWPLLALRNGGQVPPGMRGADKFVADEVKINAAQRVLTRLGSQQNLRTTVQAVEAVSKLYMAVAFLGGVDKNKRNVSFQMSQIPAFKEAQECMKHIPVPTVATTLESGNQIPKMHRFNDTISLAKQGISAPRFITLYDSAGNHHQQIVKGMDDLRQDAVMQQLFRLLNDLFWESPRARQSDLRLRTFQVVPLSPCAGIMECVQNAPTLGEILTGNSVPHEGAHHRYRETDWEHTRCRKQMQEARESLAQPGQNEAGVLEKALATCREHFQPVMNLVFLEYFPSPRDWHRARQHYARSVAVSSMVGYIVGLGDRHPNNILLDQTTGEVVHIDFGITFDQGRTLRVPELVPFRLTSDMQDGLGCLGTCGLFRRCSETTMEVLRDGAAFVTAIVDVFVHDPIYMWSLSPRKALQNKDLPPSLDVASGYGIDVGDGNEMARRSLLAVKGKLHGTHGMSASLEVPAHVGWVIREAIDPANLAKMYFGWSPWL